MAALSEHTWGINNLSHRGDGTDVKVCGETGTMLSDIDATSVKDGWGGGQQRAAATKNHWTFRLSQSLRK